jgi:hypothetical protein
MVESLASGKPVIGLARGGALEIAPPESRRLGALYENPSEEDLEAGLLRFEAGEEDFVPHRLQAHAERFSEARFQEKMRSVLASPDPAPDPVPWSFVSGSNR